MLTGVILAAGDSTRMGSPKATILDDAGVPFVVRIARTLFDAGLPEVVVITGRDHETAAGAVGSVTWKVAPRLVRNPDPSRGQLSSLWTALDACSGRADAIVMTLVDIPLLARDTVETVVATWLRTGAPIVRPEYGGRRGHPVVFDRAIFDELRRAPLDGGARTVLAAHYQEIVTVAVPDPGCVVDLDTPDEYRRAMGHAAETEQERG